MHGMDIAHADLLNQARYAERLCQRTARLYRRAQAVCTFAAIVGGSATLTALSSAVPGWVSMAGAVAFTVFGAALVVMRPADKAAANEADVRRYAKLRSDGLAMTADELAAALNKARESDAAEVEPLRDVAYNDVAREIGAPAAVVPLSMQQRLLAALA